MNKDYSRVKFIGEEYCEILDIGIEYSADAHLRRFLLPGKSFRI